MADKEEREILRKMSKEQARKKKFENQRKKLQNQTTTNNMDKKRNPPNPHLNPLEMKSHIDGNPFDLPIDMSKNTQYCPK